MVKRNDPLKLPVAEAYSIFDEPSPWDRPSHLKPEPYPSHNYNPGGPSQISSTSSTYSSSSSTLSSLSSDSVVNRPFVGNPNPSGQVFTNSGNEYKYCRLESYWEYERVCSNPVYGNLKADSNCKPQLVEKKRIVCN